MNEIKYPSYWKFHGMFYNAISPEKGVLVICDESEYKIETYSPDTMRPDVREALKPCSQIEFVIAFHKASQSIGELIFNLPELNEL